MQERLLIVAVVALLILWVAAPAIPVAEAHSGGLTRSPGIVYAGDDLTPTPTPTPAPGEGNCQGGGHCGGG